MSIDDTTLVGIVKTKQKLTAIVSGPQGFPYFIKAGDKFADGYVLSINDYQVVFRKTNERGIPLMRPKDIIKEINPEER
jgi:Tfp pilus assembly protein PilP